MQAITLNFKFRRVALLDLFCMTKKYIDDLHLYNAK